MKCKNCDNFQSYKSFYEDDNEPDYQGFCTKGFDLHVKTEDDCHFIDGVFLE